jgi:hypothetical protein
MSGDAEPPGSLSPGSLGPHPLSPHPQGLDPLPPGPGLIRDAASADTNPLTPPQAPRWVGPLFALLGVLAVPWTVYLAYSLPEQAESPHYRLAWVGFDVVLVAALFATAFLSWHGRRLVVVPAVVTATLLTMDAWFDVLTTPGAEGIVVAIASAVLLELPLAVVCVWIAGHTEQLSIRREAYLARRLARAERRVARRGVR